MSDHVIVDKYKQDSTTHLKTKAYKLNQDTEVNQLIEKITKIQKFINPQPSATVLVNDIHFMYQKSELRLVKDDTMTAVEMITRLRDSLYVSPSITPTTVTKQFICHCNVFCV
jgi:hypothetical protein